MLMQVLQAAELLDDARVDGHRVSEFLKSRGVERIEVKNIKGKGGSTDFVRITVPGKDGGAAGGPAPTIGIIGRLGGIGARPERIGMVSDADGAVTVLSCALKLTDMQARSDFLAGDVIIATHICPDAPTQPHDPVPFMGSPVEINEMNRFEVDPAMDGILSVDATKGNRIINHRGIAITPAVREGYILRVSEDLLDILAWTTGRHPFVVPLTTQDITPYGNGLYHMNSIMQPCTAASCPVVGVALTAETAVPGCCTGASREIDIEEAARFCIETAKAFTSGKCRLHDETEYQALVSLYGSMRRLQTLGSRHSAPRKDNS